MFVKKSGKTVYGADLTAEERKALDMEARRALAEHTRQHELEIEALVMRWFRRQTGYGEIRMKRAYMDFMPDLKKLCNYYELPEVDQPWICLMELKKEGFDIEAWHREAYPNEKYTVK